MTTKLIGEGAYGCVYHPGITCSGKVMKSGTKKSTDGSNYVSKLQLIDSDTSHEYEIGKIVKEITNYQSFFVPVVEECEVNIRKIDSAVLDQCTIVEKLQSSNLLSSKYDNKKISLMKSEFIKNKSFESIFKKSKKQIILDSLDSYLHMVNAVEKLVENDLVHFDLKMDNFVFSEKKKVPLFIDFGLSLNMKKLLNFKTIGDLSRSFYIFAPEYYVWPLEVHFINYLVHVNKTLSEDSVNTICRDFIQNNTSLRLFSDTTKESLTLLNISYYKRYINKKDTVVIKELMNTWKTWDIYSISQIYFNIFSIIFENGFTNNQMLVNFIQLLMLYMHPNPDRRPSLEKIKLLYNNIYVTGVHNSKSHKNMIKSINIKNKKIVPLLMKETVKLNKIINK